jgi:hypothetical protein
MVNGDTWRRVGWKLGKKGRGGMFVFREGGDVSVWGMTQIYVRPD